MQVFPPPSRAQKLYSTVSGSKEGAAAAITLGAMVCCRQRRRDRHQEPAGHKFLHRPNPRLLLLCAVINRQFPGPSTPLVLTFALVRRPRWPAADQRLADCERGGLLVRHTGPRVRPAAGPEDRPPLVPMAGMGLGLRVCEEIEAGRRCRCAACCACFEKRPGALLSMRYAIGDI